MKFKLILIPLVIILFTSWSPQPKQRIFMIGDSTMANKKTIDFPETGWGQVFGNYFSDAVEIQNHAVNGRSTKSFRDRGHWASVYAQLQKDDYVIIQFGHNDAKQDDSTRYAPATTAYRSNLIRYIEEIKSKGAIPILATPIVRRKFNADGNLEETHGDYPAVVRQVAKEKLVDLIDLHEESKKIVESHSENSSAFMFMHHPGGVFPKFKDGISDNTHFSPYGANLIAAAACKLLVQQRHPLLYFLKKSVFDQKYEFELPLIAQTYFRQDTFDIVRYGAKHGITQVNTTAIQSAIDNASASKGGVVLIPKGMWISGPIELKDNVNLHIPVGATLQFSDNRDDYPIIETTWEGQLAYRCQAPISARDKNNIAITGGGTIDGAGHVWKSVKKSKLTASQWAHLIKTGVNDGDTWYPSESSKMGHTSDWAKKITVGKTMDDYKKVRDFLRPNFVSFTNCNLVLIEGVSFNNSPAWTLHPLLCNHITVRNVKVTNPWFGQNNDAIDVESCRNGIIDNCVFDTGDDAITIKSGRDEEGRKRGVPTENFVIKNTTVYHGHGGFVIGSEMSGGVRNMYISDCSFLGTDIGLRFKTTRGRGGVVSDIYASNIQMSEIVGEAILFDMYYAAKDPIPLLGDKSENQEIKSEPFTEATPVFKNFYIDNVQCNGAATAIKINGIPESNVTNVVIKHSGFKTQKGVIINEASQIQFTNIDLYPSQGPLIDILNGNTVAFSQMRYDVSSKNIGNIKGKSSANISFKQSGNLHLNMFEIEKGINKNVVKLSK